MLLSKLIALLLGLHRFHLLLQDKHVLNTVMVAYINYHVHVLEELSCAADTLLGVEPYY